MKGIIYLKSTTSTQDEARKYIEKTNHINENVVFLAERQTNGRGRNGNAWIDDGVGNFFCSIIVSKISAISYNIFPLFVGLCVLESLESLQLTKDEIKLKWPNDIIIANKKVGGIIVEESCDKLIIGIGLNSHKKPEFYNEHSLETDAIIHHESSKIQMIENNKKIAIIISEKISNFYNETAENITEKYNKKAWKVGMAINITLISGEVVYGIFKGVKNNGNIILGDQLIDVGSVLKLR